MCSCVCVFGYVFVVKTETTKQIELYTFGTVTHFIHMKPANAMFMLRQYPDNLCMLYVCFFHLQPLKCS